MRNWMVKSTNPPLRNDQHPCFFWLNNNINIQLANKMAVSLTSFGNDHRKTTLIETKCSTKPDCILCNLMGSNIATSSNPTKITIQKEITKIKYITNNSSNGPIRLQFRYG